MKRDVLKQLADTVIPPVPPEFDRSVHDRLNTVLIVEHLFDLLLRGVPFTVAHFAEAFGDLIATSLGGARGKETPRQPEA